MSDTLQAAEADAKTPSRLPLALGIAVGVTVLVTCVSVGVYYLGGFYKFDLSRPGFESERGNVTTNDPRKTYDTTSPVDAKAIDDFLAEYDANVTALKAYGDFQDISALGDETLLPPDGQ